MTNQIPNSPPPEPSLDYDPLLGSKQAWINATVLWAVYWDSTPHEFIPCVCREPFCDKCNKCTHDQPYVMHT